jgi:hypothetical protein
MVLCHLIIHQGFRRKRQGSALGYDPSAGSPTETLLRLLLPLDEMIWRTLGEPSTNASPDHPSVVATGGVYNLQGRSRDALLTHPYKAFLVHVPQLHGTIPDMTAIKDLPALSSQQPFAAAIVARVHPRTSKGITDLFLSPLPCARHAR